MINMKNIIKALLAVMFICVCSFDARAEIPLLYNGSSSSSSSSSSNSGGSLYVPSSPKTGTCPEGQYWSSPDNSCRPNPKVNSNSNTKQDATFCGDDKGVFSELVVTGQKIFNRLRDLIYVVAGFGIIAVAVGGFFGNLNWKWLGAIVISLVVIATAGELIVLLTGCEQYGTSLITNTLEAPTESAKPVE